MPLQFIQLLRRSRFAILISSPDSGPPCKRRRRSSKVHSSLLAVELELLLFIRHVERPRDSWVSSNTVCSWEGVICSSTSPPVVRGLKWNYKDMGGNLSWTYLPQTVENLEISFNRLRGALDFSSLGKNITTLMAQNNYLTGVLPTDIFPAVVQNMKLSFNSFEKDLDLRSLPATLKSLHVDSNNLGGRLDFTCLPSGLTELLLSFNNFTHATGLENISPNVYVDLTFNLIQNLPPVWQTNIQLYGQSQAHIATEEI